MHYDDETMESWIDIERYEKIVKRSYCVKNADLIEITENDCVSRHETKCSCRRHYTHECVVSKPLWVKCQTSLVFHVTVQSFFW